ncbi:Alpha/Beta hydrolase protein [Boeremia exigua]|uniref:Alpha/Beta hydrolase protein n=1 Tax=Boeremia exigua TaxID=749465 RepID=UPI001E8ED3D2|nr:Alpha/Beta hydrolase protein [Boeremia exigua]KAH6620280.1 Alpha/Beta hydrolase protein [Boeremia exigua]
MLFPTTLLAVLAAVGAVASPLAGNSTKPVVKLDYVTLQGASSAQYNLTYYRRIPFGASTAGKNRFRAPQPPVPITNGTYDTDRGFDMCPQRTVNGSEDCLFLGVYSRPWAPKQKLRPVLLTFYGGGFIRGSAEFSIPPSGYPVLNASAANDYVVVYANYRTNVFGFLPGAKVAHSKAVDLNPGLLDQQAALRWIQRYIAAFGGDSADVTIWGQSAGGGSVVAQAIATGNRGKKLFTRALASSPFWPKTPRYDSADSEALYQEVVSDAGCAGATDEIACLQSADLQTLRASALRLSTSRQYTTSSFTFGPVLDTSFLSRPLSAVIRDRKLNAPAVLTSYNLHEGENFIPPGFNGANTASDGFNSSTASFDGWLAGFLPDLRPSDVRQLKTLYPPAGAVEELVYNTTYVRAGLVYRDLVLACPALWLADAADRGWVVEYTISPAKHASDTIYWNQLNPVQTSDPLTYTAYAGAMASFIQTGDPNAHKVTGSDVAGVPGVGEGQFVVSSTGVRQGGISMLRERCGFWLEVGKRVPI